MRYAALFGVLGIALAAAAALSAAGGAVGTAWLLIAGEFYVAACLFTMALAYGLNDRGISLGGVFRHPGWRHALDLLLLPYRLLARATYALLRRFDSMEMMHAVGTRLYVGRIPLPADHARLAAAGVTSVLNLCAEFPKLSRLDRATGLETAYLPILDGTAPSERQFHEAVEWIAARHGEGRAVLVHCAQGRGRSVTVAAAALCRLGLAADPDTALDRIRAARPKARPSRKQRAALMRYLGSGRGTLRQVSPGPDESPNA